MEETLGCHFSFSEKKSLLFLFVLFMIDPYWSLSVCVPFDLCLLLRCFLFFFNHPLKEKLRTDISEITCDFPGIASAEGLLVLKHDDTLGHAILEFSKWRVCAAPLIVNGNYMMSWFVGRLF